MIRLVLVGDFWNRQPLAYAPIRDRLSGRIQIVDDPRDAQIALFCHTHDLTHHAAALAHMKAAHPRLRPVLLSEEPFWDTCWAPDPFTLNQTWVTGQAALGYTVLNHATSDIFNTSAIPYFLLTDPRYVARYRPLFARNAGFAVSDWLIHWHEAHWDAAFVAEKRETARHDRAFPAQDVWGLSVLRGEITRSCKGARVLRTGMGWDSATKRADLPDWHAEKLARLDLKCRYVSAVENTHQANYVTEKIFDAFAVGGIPLYIASDRHRVLQYVGPEGAWVNLASHLPRPDAALAGPFDANISATVETASAFAATQDRLARLFSTPGIIEDELDQLCQRLYRALHRTTL